jgi:hypothetical protein
MPDSTDTLVDFTALLLGTLGFTDTEFVSLLYDTRRRATHRR